MDAAGEAAERTAVRIPVSVAAGPAPTPRLPTTLTIGLTDP